MLIKLEQKYMRRTEEIQQQNSNVDDNFKKIDEEVKLHDLYHKMYLNSLQMKLDQRKDGLPAGLKIVNRKSQTQYDILQIGKQKLLTYEEFQNKKKKQAPQVKNYQNYFVYAKENHADNLLCQMKAHGTPLQMGVCICMYNEDRKMLENTLKGVAANIYQLWKQGVDPDKIFVTIVQDGIQKMNESIKPLFEIFQNESGIRYQGQELKFQERINQLQRVQSMRSEQKIEVEDSVTNMSSFLFPPDELEARKKNRFLAVKKEYDQIKKLQKQINELKKKKNITYLDLSGIILDFYEKLCYENHTGQPYPYAKLDQNAKNIVQQHYNDDIKKSQPFIKSALNKAAIYCNQYISSRMDMAHVSFFRVSYYFPSQFDSQANGSDEQNTPLLTEKTSSLKYLKKIKQAIKMNIFFVVKYQNAQKLSSHNWFFNGFCKEFCDFEKDSGKMKSISPKYTILLDVGLRPHDDALVKMYNVMQNHQKIGGVCGYMNLKLQNADQSQNPTRFNLDTITEFCLNFVDIQRAQQLQYHFAHLIDKGFESIFEFIHVLPGAFSGYNMKAIWGQIDENRNQIAKIEEKENISNVDKLLLDYFSSISQKLSGNSYQNIQLSLAQVIFRVILPNILVKCLFKRSNKNNAEQLLYNSNVNLAEDRILCMGIHKNQKNLIFLPDAHSFVDPVKDLPGLLGQRKRWINGSYFAFDKVSDQFQQEQGCCHLLAFQINYLALMNLLAYVAPGFYLFSVSVAMEAFKADVLTKFFQDTLTETSQVYGAFVYTINFIYALLIGGLVFFSVNIKNNNQKFVRYSYALSTFLGIMSLIMMTILVVDLIRGLGSSTSYLINNSTFTQNIPGGQQTVDILRYIVLGIMGLYVLPLALYTFLFGNFRIIAQILAGAISFVFYQPTYLIILSTYALCRMDDLSWGTKGLESDASNQSKSITKTWQKIKTVHVGKFVFWNVIVAAFLIHFGSNYLVRFWLTFALMIIISSTMLIKVLLALVYYLIYKFCIKNTPKTTKNNIVPCLYRNFDQNSFPDGNLGTQLRGIIRNNAEKLRNACQQENGQTNHSIAAMQLLARINGITRKTQNKSNQGLGVVFSGINKIMKDVTDKKKNKFKKEINLTTNLKPIKQVNEGNDGNEGEISSSNLFPFLIPTENNTGKKLAPIDPNKFKKTNMNKI